MITTERYSGRPLPQDLNSDNLGLTFSFRVADTQGVTNSNTNWIYTQLPDTAVLGRQRSASIDQFSQQVSISVLEDALPDGFAILQYMVLEIDCVDRNGYAWPYHTGPIDSITESFELVEGSIKRVLDITSFGVIQYTKGAHYFNQFFQPATSTLTGYLTAYATVKHSSYVGTGRAIGTIQVISNTWNTVDAQLTNNPANVNTDRFIVSTDSTWTTLKTRGVDYEITDVAGVALNTATSAGSLLYIRWLTLEPNATVYVKYWTLEFFAVSRTGFGIFPQTLVLPDYNEPFANTFQPTTRRNLWDDFVTTIAAGATTTVVTPVDSQPWRDISNIPGWMTEYVELQRADQSAPLEVSPVSSINAGTGAITVAVAFSSAPAAGDYIRLVTTRPYPAFERFNNPGTFGALTQPQFYRDGGFTLFPNGAFEIKPDQGMVVPVQGYHFRQFANSLYVTGLNIINQVYGTLGSDNRSESLVWQALTGNNYLAAASIFTGDANDGANYYGRHFPMGSYAQNVDASGDTRASYIQRIADNGFPPNGKLFDRPDGTVLVAALRQSAVPQYNLSNIVSMTKNFVPEPPTAVTVVSSYPEARRLDAGHFSWVQVGMTNPNYLFDGVDAPDPNLTGTDYAFASSASGTVQVTIPNFGPTILDVIDKVIIKGISGCVRVSLQTINRTTNAVRTHNRFWGGTAKLISDSTPIEISADEFSKAYQRSISQNAVWGTTYSTVMVFEFLSSSIIPASPMDARVTEIELWSKYNASWTALLTDDLVEASDSGVYPTGWDSTSSVTNAGPTWWKRRRNLAASFKYFDTASLKRIQARYDANWNSSITRNVTVNQTRISMTECKNIAERFMDESIIKSNTYTVQALIDPRVELGDTVGVSLPDGSVLNLFVYSISDSGEAIDQVATYELVDYSGLS